MSKQEKLLDALSGARDCFIEEGDLSETRPAGRNGARPAAVRRRMLAVGTAAALVCAAGLICAGFMLNRHGEQAPAGQRKWETKYDDRDHDRTADDEILRELTWEEKSPVQRYPEAEYRGVRYSVSGSDPKGTAVPAERLGDELGDFVLTGHDVYTNQSHTTGATLYAIGGIDPACAVAVQMEDQSEAYAYMNNYYRPATLGDLLDSLSLEQNLTFGSVYIEETGRNGESYTVEFPGVSDGKLRALLADRDAVCASPEEYDDRFTVSVNLPLLGISNLSLSVTTDGWLHTNLTGQGHAFFIGNDAADAFMDYLLTECKGYRLIEPDAAPSAGSEE